MFWVMKQTMTTTLRNEFHNTSYTTRLMRFELRDLNYRDQAKGDQNARRVIRRISKALCGIKDCRCGQDLFSQNLADRSGLIG